MKPYLQEQKKRVCLFCVEKRGPVDYKEVPILKTFLSDRGKITPRRISGNCALHQRQVTHAIKRSRNIALMSFAEER
ncbi:MAG: 30S ribosomal protein S18 [Nitrospirae bacterium]|nr:30S ribosomal protein S18 [Candidatus Troglogloeales bacterium]MBI3598969.1 30S ribosomal protein S18 [Candidatus Troglogloeales bacterium]